MRKLVILSGQAKGQQIELTQGATSVGRADENNLVLEDDSVSRRHALLTFDGAEYRLRDVGSRNGTRVNSKPVLETKLVPGDIVHFGEVEIRYEAIGLKIVTPPGSAPVDTERVKQLQAQVDQLAAQNRDLGAKISTAEQQLVAAQKGAAERGAAELTKSDADLAKVRAELDEARKAATQLESLQKERQTLASQLAVAQQLAAEASVAKSQVATLVLERQQLQKQLEGANQQLVQERAQAAEREATVRTELQRTATELVTTKQELTEAKKLATRVEELTTQNRALETQLGDIKVQLTGAQKDLNTAWQDVTVARQKIATLERVGGDTGQAQAELAKLREELVQAKQAAERVEGLSQERQRLAAQLTGVEQQMIQAREQAQREAAQAKQLQDELVKTREQIELAKKETAKITVMPRSNVAAKPAPETARLSAELVEAQSRLKAVNVELTKTKSELDHLRQAAPVKPALQPAKPRAEIPLKIAPVVAPQTETADRRRLLDEQIAALEKKIAEAETQSPEAETEEIRKWKADLAGARANLYNIVMKTPRSLASPSQPVGTDTSPRLAESPRKKMSVGMLVGLAAIAVVGLSAVVWWYVKLSTPALPVPRAVVLPKIEPLAPPKVITEPVAVPAPTNVPPVATTVIKPEAVNHYKDPQGRFECFLPEGWQLEEKSRGNDESSLLLTAGKDSLTVTAYGKEWPPLQKSDQKQVEAALFDRLKVAYPEGLFSQMIASAWRTMEGEPALLMESSVTLSDKVVSVRSVEYRKDGHAHVIEMHIATQEQAALLAGLFDRFLSRYESVGTASPSTGR